MDGLFRRRRLPHLDVDGATYFVTTCLFGSIPAIGLKALNEYRIELDAKERPADFSESDWRIHKDKLHFARMDSWLDGKSVVKHFVHDVAAECVRNSLFHFADERYDLIAHCVMPSHLHWVFKPRPSWCDEVAEMNRQRLELKKKRQAGSLPHFLVHQILTYPLNSDVPPCSSRRQHKRTGWLS